MRRPKTEEKIKIKNWEPGQRALKDKKNEKKFRIISKKERQKVQTEKV